MDEYSDPHRLPEDIDPWAASEGLPEVADDESYADSVHEAARDPDAPSPLPPDREEGPLGLDEYGVTQYQGLRGEPLAGRLHRELPEGVTDDRLEPDPQVAADLDLDEPALGRRADPAGRVAEDTRLIAEEEPVDPRLDSQVSVYDRPEPGIAAFPTVGEIVRPGSGYSSYEKDEVAFDLGSGLGGLGGEELAMHEIPPDEVDLEEAQSTSEPYVSREYVVRTGAEQPWDPEDLAVAEGRDPTPRNIERARRELDKWGPAAIEKTVP
jgi:hypothetical protein